MKNFSVNLKGRPVKEIKAEELKALEALKLLEAKGLDRVLAVKVNGENMLLLREEDLLGIIER